MRTVFQIQGKEEVLGGERGPGRWCFKACKQTDMAAFGNELGKLTQPEKQFRRGSGWLGGGH